jgi:hypothetical protein
VLQELQLGQAMPIKAQSELFMQTGAELDATEQYCQPSVMKMT